MKLLIGPENILLGEDANIQKRNRSKDKMNYCIFLKILIPAPFGDNRLFDFESRTSKLLFEGRGGTKT